MEEAREKGLIPLIGDAPRVLVLGSFPSRTSLEKGWYYANPRNQFWKVMKDLLDLPVLDREGIPARDYPAFLVRNHISLWDVVASRRFQQGSMDRDLREIRVNDIAGVLRDHPTITCIALNGGKAWTLFPRGTIPASIPVYRLPSTSPANTRHSLAEKIAEWRVILQYLGPEAGVR